MIGGVTIWEIIWTGGLRHLSGLPHLPVPHLRENRPFVSISPDFPDCQKIKRIKSREKRLRESLGLKTWLNTLTVLFRNAATCFFWQTVQILYEKYNRFKRFTLQKMDNVLALFCYCSLRYSWSAWQTTIPSLGETCIVWSWLDQTRGFDCRAAKSKKTKTQNTVNLSGIS